jgi:hypothetical protein
MQRTTVYFETAAKRRLERLARLSGRSEAELIRTALDRLLDDEGGPRPTLPLFRSGDPGLAERVDEELARGFGG